MALGLLALPGYKTSYNVRSYLPATPANIGYDAAAERHFSAARLNPEMDDRNRPRHAEPGQHAGAGEDRQSRLQHFGVAMAVQSITARWAPRCSTRRSRSR